MTSPELVLVLDQQFNAAVGRGLGEEEPEISSGRTGGGRTGGVVPRSPGRRRQMGIENLRSRDREIKREQESKYGFGNKAPSRQSVINTVPLWK
jgi:hypothetical protein